MRECSGPEKPCEFVIGRSERCGAARAYEIAVALDGVYYCRSLCLTHFTTVRSRSRVADGDLRIDSALACTPAEVVEPAFELDFEERVSDRQKPPGRTTSGKRLSIYREMIARVGDPRLTTLAFARTRLRGG